MPTIKNKKDKLMNAQTNTKEITKEQLSSYNKLLPYRLIPTNIQQSEKCGRIAFNLFQLETTIDGYFGMPKGTKGGYVENPDNITGLSWVGPDCYVFGGARVVHSKIEDETMVSDNARIKNSVLSHSVVSGNSFIISSFVSGQSEVMGESFVKYSFLGNSKIENATIENSQLAGSTVIKGTVRDCPYLFLAKIGPDSFVTSSFVERSTINDANVTHSHVSKKSLITAGTIAHSCISDTTTAGKHGQVMNSWVDGLRIFWSGQPNMQRYGVKEGPCCDVFGPASDILSKHLETLQKNQHEFFNHLPYKLTDSTTYQRHTGSKKTTVYQLETTIDGYLGMPKGTKGGYVESLYNIGGFSWIEQGGYVVGDATVNHSYVGDQSVVSDRAWLDNSRIYDSKVWDSAMAINSTLKKVRLSRESYLLETVAIDSIIFTKRHLVAIGGKIKNTKITSSTISDEVSLWDCVIEETKISNGILQESFVNNSIIAGANVFTSHVSDNCILAKGTTIRNSCVMRVTTANTYNSIDNAQISNQQLWYANTNHYENINATKGNCCRETTHS